MAPTSAASAKIVDLLMNTARPFIFSTALPPPAIGAALAALALLDRGRAWSNSCGATGPRSATGWWTTGSTGRSRTQIVPVVVGDARRAMALCERSLEGGVFAQAIRPPTVPEGTSRLRLSVMANHRADELVAAARVIGRAARELGITPKAPERGIPQIARLGRAA